MSRALARHDALLRTVFAEYRGHIFKTIGDAFCVAFSSVFDAVSAATAVQRGLAAEPWEETDPLRVRIAIHSGEVDERDSDYFGPPLNRIARLLAAGHGGQTLLSRIAAEVVREKLPRGVTLRDLGERRLKDLHRPEQVFQLVPHDLPSEFPPLRSLEVLPNNLPAQVTSFIGRAREQAEVKRLLTTTRLVTLTGSGGTGKTRLSLQVAAEVLETFPHGVWLVELATLSDPALLPESVAAVLGVREEVERPLPVTLLSALRARRLLLILDNCEHLIEACAALVETLLKQCPEVHILATSREPLHITGESTWPVPPLKTASFWNEEAKGLSFENITALEAVQLFVDRANAVQPNFSLTAESARAVGEIVWRLDGIPLAIELAAARVKVLSPPQILARLDNRFRLLSGGSRTALPRQQTLGALIDWSYDLLSSAERALLRRLAVFAGGRTLEMAEQVCSGDGIEAWEVLDLLGSLIDKSLVSVELGERDETRYVMLESVWDYAREKLTEAGETERHRDRHLDYFLQFAERAEPQLMQAGQAAWLEQLEGEIVNLRMALERAAESGGDAEKGLRLAGALGRFWEVRGYFKEAREYFTTLLARARDSGTPRARMKALGVDGRLAWCQDQDVEALACYREALQISETLGSKSEAGFLEAYCGFAHRNLNDQNAAAAAFNRATALAREEANDRLMAIGLSGLGSLTADVGDLAAARAHKEDALRIFRRLGDKWIVGIVAWSTGRIAVAQRDFAAAQELFTESGILGRQLGNRWSIPYTLEGFGDVALERGRAAVAARLYGAAEALREEAGLCFSPTEQTAHEAAVARIRDQISVELFNAEWAHGRLLDAGEALQFAGRTGSDGAERAP